MSPVNTKQEHQTRTSASLLPTGKARMSTLILGHGKLYAQKHKQRPGEMWIRCSPIDTKLWLDDAHTSVDIDANMLPDIVYDLKKLPWAFAGDGSFDRIIDTCGMGLERLYKQPKFIQELDRVLAAGGTFVGWSGFTYKRDGGGDERTRFIPSPGANHL